MFTVLAPEPARQAILDRFAAFSPAIQTVGLAECLGRTLAADVTAGEDVPGFTRSMVDGYAVVAADTFGASQALPAMLRQVGSVRMGMRPDFLLGSGECAYVPTGGELPEGSDAMVMIEYASELCGDRETTVLIEKPASPGNKVIFCGDDVRAGEVVLQKGRLCRPQEIGTLAALGICEVPVYARVRVGVLSTGDELLPVDAPIPAGKAVVRDVNTHALCAGLVQAGCEPVAYGIVRDDWDSLRAALRRALCECDAVLISGGSSVGKADMTARAIDDAGSPGTFIHGLAVKPGKPTIVGDVEGTPVFGLPGHPVSAYFVFHQFVLPLLRRGMGDAGAHSVFARMACNAPSGQGREEYLPVRLERRGDQVLAHPIRYKSGLISALSQADGFVCIPRDKEGQAAGELVRVECM